MAKQSHIRWQVNDMNLFANIEENDLRILSTKPLVFLRNYIEYPHYPEDEVLNDEEFKASLAEHIIEKIIEGEFKGIVNYEASFKII